MQPTTRMRQDNPSSSGRNSPGRTVVDGDVSGRIGRDRRPRWPLQRCHTRWGRRPLVAPRSSDTRAYSRRPHRLVRVPTAGLCTFQDRPESMGTMTCRHGRPQRNNRRTQRGPAAPRAQPAARRRVRQALQVAPPRAEHEERHIPKGHRSPSLERQKPCAPPKFTNRGTSILRQRGRSNQRASRTTLCLGIQNGRR
ncbi:MAG: hypothetical protein ACI9OJ_000913 [Myxococcota bacterium]|jgi:hypothetical protein